ncbi:MAG: PhaM family polyhydroxyalkanoate granule multifunctional regulatory protein [Rhizobacter sp.]
MADTPSFTNMVPGFDFLQNLVKNAGSAMPAMGQWIAPTINPEELEKRIGELRTVQFWLEQNARMLGATIQALEVQRMTLSTLKTMNVQMGDLRDSLRARPPAPSEPPPAPAPSAEPAPEAPREPAAKSSKGSPSSAAAGEAAAAMVDPVQWWGALTKQFTQLAANAMQEPQGTPVGEPAPKAARPAAKSARKSTTAGAARKRPTAPKR